jgi:hypothetical protein
MGVRVVSAMPTKATTASLRAVRRRTWPRETAGATGGGVVAYGGGGSF